MHFFPQKNMIIPNSEGPLTEGRRGSFYFLFFPQRGACLGMEISEQRLVLFFAELNEYSLNNRRTFLNKMIME